MEKTAYGGRPKMKMMDCVKVIAEKNEYARDGVHKGMYGWICDERNISSSWLVNFPQCGEKADIETLPIKEKDLIQVPVMHAIVNEQIKAEFETGFCDGGKVEGDNCVEVTAEVPEYVKHGVHKGMQGLILPEQAKEKGYLTVRFPQSGDDDIVTIPVREEDLMYIQVMYAIVNNVIKHEFEWEEQHYGNKKS